VTGAGGQVGRALSKAIWPEGFEVSCLTRADLDITNPEAVKASFDRHGPDLVINAAAYTDVAKAEVEPALAYQVNAVGPALLAEQSRAHGSALIHISTDFVFSGQGPHAEDAIPAPLNLYGASKYAGEQAVLLAHDRSVVVRTAWVFDAHGPNFVTKLLAQQQAPVIKVVDDEIGSPTSADDIATGLIHLSQFILTQGANAPRILHLVNLGEASRFEMAQAILDRQSRLGQVSPDLIPVSSASFNSKVKRPADSRLQSTRLSAILAWQAPSWRDALERVLDQRPVELHP